MRTAAAAVVATWLLVSVGGMQNPGFKQYEQYLSALSAAGTHDPGWGRAALIVTGFGILVMVPLFAAWRLLLGATSLVAAAAAVAMSVLPMNCPASQRFCTDGATAGSTVEVGHAAAVLIFATAVVATVLAGMWQILAGSGNRPSLWPAVPVAVALVAIGAAPLLNVTGLAQRSLLLLAQVLLVLLGSLGAAELSRRERQRRRLRALNRSERAPKHLSAVQQNPDIRHGG